MIIDAPYEATAQIVEDSRIYFMSTDRFRGLWESEPAIPKLFARLLAKRLGEAQTELVNMGSHTIRERLARLILQGQEKSRPAGAPFVLAHSRQEIAEVLATSPEVVCRTLGSFEHDGLIDIEGCRVQVLDPNRLGRVAHLLQPPSLTFIKREPSNVKTTSQVRRA